MSYKAPNVSVFRLSEPLCLLKGMSHDAEWGNLEEADKEFGE